MEQNYHTYFEDSFELEAVNDHANRGNQWRGRIERGLILDKVFSEVCVGGVGVEDNDEKQD